jgi:cell wall assembly regulator SMI1
MIGARRRGIGDHIGEAIAWRVLRPFSGERRTLMGDQGEAPPVARSWNRIEAWIAEHMPDALDELGAGAKPAAIRSVEKMLGAALPDDYKASCAIHDGQDEEFDLIPIGFGTYYLLRLGDIAEAQATWNAVEAAGDFEGRVAVPDAGVVGAWWHRSWVPFAANGGGDHLCLDLAPAPGGNPGQVIKVEHDRAERELLAPSFAAWLCGLADALEGGELDDFLD